MWVEIAGLDKLPEDDNGVDVEAVFAHVRRAIMGRARWDVEDSVYLSIFSFSKFILWNDIRNNRDHILSHKVVDSLVQHQLQWLEEPEEQRDLDQAIHPSSLPLPIATDSSQLEAILSSMEGKSFVLHGPPGTGKSQTITNMIAAALYQNKRVLFVASKKAALEVVQKRLESIGLGSFCLELHSNKATKS